eukprot:gene6215-biopygen2811
MAETFAISPPGYMGSVRSLLYITTRDRRRPKAGEHGPAHRFRYTALSCPAGPGVPPCTFVATLPPRSSTRDATAAGAHSTTHRTSIDSRGGASGGDCGLWNPVWRLPRATSGSDRASSNHAELMGGLLR